MYFKNRAQAGRLLADKLEQYKSELCTVVALSEGALLVGAQISHRLHTPLTILFTERIDIPGETDPYGTVSSGGSFTTNNMFSAGQLEEFAMEFYQHFEAQKLEKFHRLNQLIGQGGEINHALLRRHVIILVADGLSNGLSLDVAADFLKPIEIKHLVIVSPIASIDAVDRMHLLGDEIYCLSVPENYIKTDHYYDDNTLPNHDQLMDIINTNSLRWASPA
jgi:putative phosphoribosyl transferase